MNNLQEFYTTKVNGFEKQIEALNKQLFTFSILRLLIFLGTIVAIYFASVDAKYVIGVLCVGIPLFLYLVSKYTNLKHQKSKLEALKEINAVELQVLNRDYSNLPNGKEYADDIHYFSQDIDLFGEGSFYQVSNRTKLAEGSLLLADIYKENSINEIKEKQEAIAEIAEKVDWRQEFSAMAVLTKTETSTRTIATWLKNYKSFVPKAMKFIPSVFSIFSVTIFIAYFLDYLPESVLITWLVLGMVIVGLFTKKVTNLGQSASKMKSTFDQYNQLLAMIEETEFTSNLLKRQKANILSNGEQNSKVLKKFASLLSNLDRNNNLLYLIFANGFFLRSLTDCLAVEKWIEEHGKSVETWFNTIAFFDAYNSLGNFAFNHPNFTYPTITGDEVVLNSKNAGHPLLDPKKSILNDITIEGGQFFIITGANMAGKSTFLRTVSLQIMMANVGLPVCAQEVSYSPIKLITSMRTTDSLTDDESYFFSELKRLRYIVDEIQVDRYFIVLDEILKGTNSTDKALGSRKFVERLVKSKSTGIIATHDLSLCEVANEYNAVKNHYFDAEIIDNELHFDYTFKDGICQNMNASFLLKKMGIIE
ncbi:MULTISPECIES: MutS-related protein [unclassified Maribacter]|uniref:MutS-related protein n=1 Tax=unclassified Maribacter TaxID=2615042 RepID=UPI00257A276C|nr:MULTISPECIES: DNA mismatch repair protein MutS [unclassified Maribacter]|tara:strand:- start:18799 stop:20571 length:1773 start_codon:yes stop_codon:yes gene_type:complete